jgi:hypothetical protein
MKTNNDNTIELLQALREARFWGALTIKFEDGRIVHLRKEENIKPEELLGELKSKYGSRNNVTSRN